MSPAAQVRRHVLFCFVAVTCAVIFSRAALGANVAPLAQVSATPVQVFEGDSVQLSSAGSSDPDNGPQPLTFTWDFGDGTTSSDSNPTHVYAASGAYTVGLTLSDGADTALASCTVYVLAHPTLSRPTHSDTLALSSNDQDLWVVNPDSDSVTLFNVAGTTPQKTTELSLVAGAHPRSLALSPDNAKVYVTCQDRNTLAIIDTASLAVVSYVAVGHQPYGVAVVPTDGRILICNQGGHSITVLYPDLAVAGTIDVPDGPRALAVTCDGARAFVTHYLTRGAQGTVTELNLGSLSVAKTIGLAEDPGPDGTGISGKGFPNLLSTIGIEPSGRSAWVGGLKSNTGRGLFLSGAPLGTANRVRGMFTRLDLLAEVDDIAHRTDTWEADSVTGIAFSPDGRFAYVCHQGIAMFTVYDLLAPRPTPFSDPVQTFVTRIAVGDAPQGVAVNSTGRGAYVMNYLSRNVSVVDLSDPASAFVSATVTATSESLPSNLANGKKLFYSSAAPRLSKTNYIACASCHADGGMSDGRTWDFTQSGEGLRNTIDLRGHAGTGMGPLHWTANFDEVQDFENDLVNEFGGTGLAQDGKPPNPPLGAPNAGRSQDLDDLAAYVTSLSTPPKSPFRNPDGTLTAAALRGKRIFNSPATSCSSCHIPARFTDSVLFPNPADYLLHNVGTLTAASGSRMGGPLTGLKTPTLLGVWDTAPYLHDGSAPTLLDVLTTKNPNDKHGVTSGLSSGDRADLVDYLNSIDGSTNDEAPAILSLSAAPNPAVPGAPLTFSIAALDGDGDSLSYSWDFGDGGSGSGSAPVHTYFVPGNYVAIVSVSDGKGAVTSASVSIQVVAASPNPGPGAISILKSDIRFRLNSKGMDSCAIRGVIAELPPGFQIPRSEFAFNLNGISAAFTCDAKGYAHSGKNRFSLKKIRSARNSEAPTNGWEFSAVFSGHGWAALLEGNGLSVAGNQKNLPIQLNLNLLVNGSPYAGVIHGIFNSSSNSAGQFLSK